MDGPCHSLVHPSLRRVSAGVDEGWLLDRVCSRAALGADAGGGPHVEVGMKPQQSPRGCATKEEKLKSLLTAVGTSDLHHHCWLCKLSACRTSKLKSAPSAETGLALAPVHFVSTYTWGLDEARIWAPPKPPTVGPGTGLLKSLDLTLVDLCWWPGENNAWETPGPIASIPTVKVELREVPTTVQFVFLFFLAMPSGIWDLNSLTREWTHVLCLGSVKF